MTTKLSPSIFFILLGFNLLFLIVLDIFSDLIMLPKFQHAIHDDAEDIFRNLGLFLLLGGLITPVIEELIFRYFLVGNDFRKVLLSLFSLIVLSLVGFSRWSFGDFINLLCLTYFIIVLILFLVYKGIKSKTMIFSSILLFGVIHLSKFQFEEIKNNIFFVPILILPQVVLGYFLVFFRINFGLIYAILYHAVYNTVLVSIAYVLYLLTGEFY